jgi:hypothetical protein
MTSKLAQLSLLLSITLVGCGSEPGDSGDRAIQVVLEETGYAPFG